MAYTTTKEMLQRAQAGGYAVGAFNVENMEMTEAVLAAAEALNAPVIVQVSASSARYAGGWMFAAMVRAAAERAKVPVALHFDHGESYEILDEMLGYGYSSVMIDASRLEFAENVKLTRKVVVRAAEFAVPVEAELGKVGGKEDDIDVKVALHTDPAEAARFARETGVDSLAVAIGTAHGFYRSTPQLDVERLAEIRAVVDVPLVLHGSSGLSAEAIGECVRRGICKVNFATEVRQAFSDGLREGFAVHPQEYDPRVYLKAGRAAVEELVKNRILMCGCAGRV